MTHPRCSGFVLERGRRKVRFNIIYNIYIYLITYLPLLHFFMEIMEKENFSSLQPERKKSEY